MATLRKKLISVLKKNDYLFFIIKYWRLRYIMRRYKNVSDEEYIKKQYRMRTGKNLNLDNPQLYNEKIQYAKLHYHNPQLKCLVDKYAVREYVSEKIGEQHLNKLYGVYDCVDDIPFDELPDKFVLKLTNGSGYNYICKHKTPKEIRKIKRRFKKWINVDFYMLGREWAYKGIKNRIICEEYLQGSDAYGLNDYKIFCFDGVPKIIVVHYCRFTGHKANIYTPEWEFIDEEIGHPNDKNANIPKPENLECMLECAGILSKGLPHVRVDFYDVDNKVIFGELTFYNGAGYAQFNHENFERELGSYWKM